MKLAEALAARADAQTRLRELRGRIEANAFHQEGDQPAEDPNALLVEADRVAAELERLIRAVNRTNATTAFDDTRTLTDALAQRDVLGFRRKLYTESAGAAAGGGGRFPRTMRTELRFVSALSVPDLRRQADELARQYRELDTRIQELNWSTEVLEG